MDDLQLSEDLLPDGWLGVYKGNLDRFSWVSPGAERETYTKLTFFAMIVPEETWRALTTLPPLPWPSSGRLVRSSFRRSRRAPPMMSRRARVFVSEAWMALRVRPWPVSLCFLLGSVELDVELGQLEHLEVALCLERPLRLADREHRSRESASC